MTLIKRYQRHIDYQSAPVDPNAFREWFVALWNIAYRSGNRWIIDRDSPESYRDYFEDGDTPMRAYQAELRHALREAA